MLTIDRPTRLVLLLCTAAVFAALAGCGGGGDSGNPHDVSTQPVPCTQPVGNCT